MATLHQKVCLYPFLILHHCSKLDIGHYSLLFGTFGKPCDQNHHATTALKKWSTRLQSSSKKTHVK